ncbi:hypothetical protein, conserved, partial [Eimeria tenella]
PTAAAAAATGGSPGVSSVLLDCLSSFFGISLSLPSRIIFITSAVAAAAPPGQAIYAATKAAAAAAATGLSSELRGTNVRVVCVARVLKGPRKGTKNEPEGLLLLQTEQHRYWQQQQQQQDSSTELCKGCWGLSAALLLQHLAQQLQLSSRGSHLLPKAKGLKGLCSSKCLTAKAVSEQQTEQQQQQQQKQREQQWA